MNEARARPDTAREEHARAEQSNDNAQLRLSQIEDLIRVLDEFESGGLVPPEDGPAPLPSGKQPSVPRLVIVGRTGVTGTLTPISAGALGSRAWEFIESRLPRVELFTSQQEITDVASRDTIRDPTNDFMRGIFLYAGLESDDWDTIFDQNPITTRRLDEASKQLNESLRESWSQGREARIQA